jgi:glycosyltransferase involved in cell wall biosynthesis
VRVLHVCLDGNLPRYGVGLAVVRLVEGLALAGERVTLACRAQNAASLGLRGVAVVPLVHRGGPLGSRRRYLAQMRPALRAPQDVVHVHSLARAARWLLPARVRRGAALALTCHSEEELGRTASAAGTATPARARRHRRHVRATLAGADAVVVASRHTRALALAAGAPEARVHEIGLGPTDDAPGPRLAHEGFVVAGLLRLVESKAPLLLLEAFATAFAADPEATLVLAGDGPLRDACAARAASLGVAPRVRLPGWVEGEERRALLATADVVAVPSVSGETFCLAALDAQNAGAPLVVTDHGPLPERAAGGAAVVVPAGDVPALAGALRRVRDDPALASALADRGRAEAARRSWATAVEAHRRMYGGLRRTSV